MKINKRIKLYASIGLTLGLLVGCGGGDSDDATSSSSLATLDPETSELIAKNIAESLPGCSFVAEGAAVNMAPDASVNMIKASVAQFLDYGNAEKAMYNARLISAKEVNETFVGSCPSFPGSYSTVGTHDDGVDDVVMTFDKFCLGTDTEYTIVNGGVAIKNVGVPSDDGPIPQSSEISTIGAGIQVTEKSDEGTFTHVAVVDDLKYTYGNGEDDPTAASPSTLVVDAISIKDGRSNDDFSVSNVDIATYVAGETEVVKITSITYIDPENGQVTISTSDLIMDDEGVMTSGSITATGADNTSMSLTPSASADNVFTVTVDGQSIGDMNCTELDVDTDAVLGEE